MTTIGGDEAAAYGLKNQYLARWPVRIINRAPFERRWQGAAGKPRTKDNEIQSLMTSSEFCAPKRRTCRTAIVGAKVIVEHDRDPTFAKQPPVVGIEVVGDKHPAVAIQPLKGRDGGGVSSADGVRCSSVMSSYVQSSF